MEAVSAKATPNASATFAIGHTRYTTQGSFTDLSQTQPLITKYGRIALVHNGQVQIHSPGFEGGSDSVWLLSVLEECLADVTNASASNNIELAFRRLFVRVVGSYACIAFVKGVGLFAFRDPRGIRPLVLGRNIRTGTTAFASESCALPDDCDLRTDIAPGQVVFVDVDTPTTIRFFNPLGGLPRKPQLCLFEFIYLASGDSTIDGISVEEARKKLGVLLAPKVLQYSRDRQIDVIVPIPHTPVVAGKELSRSTGIPFVELLQIISRRSSAENRTFILPTTAARETAVRLKFCVKQSAIESCRGKSVLLLDDSIVRGTTLKHVIQLLRDEVQPAKIYVASLAPPIISPNVYGIDIPEAKALIAYRSLPDSNVAAGVGRELGLDGPVIYQTLSDLVSGLTEDKRTFEDSVFRG